MKNSTWYEYRNGIRLPYKHAIEPEIIVASVPDVLLFWNCRWCGADTIPAGLESCNQCGMIRETLAPRL